MSKMGKAWMVVATLLVSGLVVAYGMVFYGGLDQLGRVTASLICTPNCEVTQVKQDGVIARRNAFGEYMLTPGKCELEVKTTKGTVSQKYEVLDVEEYMQVDLKERKITH